MKKIIYILIFILSLNSAKGQDFHLSMYDAAPMFLNPAMTGLVDADWRVHLHYRNQWKAVNFKPYNTALVSFDAPYKKWGFGGQITNYRAGIGNYNVFQALASAAYSIPFDANKNHNLALGTQFGVTQKSIEFGLHTFDNQYTTSQGGGFDNQQASNESFAGQSIVLPELNAGAMYYYSKQQSKLNPFVGGSVFNLLQPEETFFSGNNKLPMRTYLHAGTRINIKETFYLIPKVLIMNQESVYEETYALDVGYFLKNAELYLLGGLTYRSQDAAILYLGARKSNFIAKLGYDFNTSTLSPATSGRGGFEISFTYIKRDPKEKRDKICPRL